MAGLVSLTDHCYYDVDTVLAHQKTEKSFRERYPEADRAWVCGCASLGYFLWFDQTGECLCRAGMLFFSWFFYRFIGTVAPAGPDQMVEVFLGLMVIAGIYIIFHFDEQYKTGIILGTSSAVLLAFVMIIFRQFVHRSNPETILTYQMTGAFSL
jgi:hypothetical protein